MVLTLEEMGFEIEASHHEVAPAQHEIDFKYDEALATADNIMTFKLAVKTIAKRHGLHATFMPKPKAGVNGSGMHINMSLADKDGRNMFVDEEDPLGLSRVAYQFMAGILNHMPGKQVLRPSVYPSGTQYQPADCFPGTWTVIPARQTGFPFYTAGL